MSTRALPLPQGYQYFWFDEIDSTNQEALRQCAGGQEPNSWFTAGQQTMGRGTKGNKWISQVGNLHASLLTRSSCRPEHLAQISILAALSAITAIEQLASNQFQLGDLCLKWPNDILLKGNKVCGILVESRPSAQTGLFDIVIGSVRAKNYLWHSFNRRGTGCRFGSMGAGLKHCASHGWSVHAISAKT